MSAATRPCSICCPRPKPVPTPTVPGPTTTRLIFLAMRVRHRDGIMWRQLCNLEPAHVVCNLPRIVHHTRSPVATSLRRSSSQTSRFPELFRTCRAMTRSQDDEDKNDKEQGYACQLCSTQCCQCPATVLCFLARVTHGSTSVPSWWSSAVCIEECWRGTCSPVTLPHRIAWLFVKWSSAHVCF